MITNGCCFKLLSFEQICYTANKSQWSRFWNSSQTDYCENHIKALLHLKSFSGQRWIHTPTDTLSLTKEEKIFNGEKTIIFSKWCWLFTIARTWKQPRCPLADGWIRKLWYVYTMEYYSAIKRDAFESVLMRWMKLELIIQSEVSQKEKHQYSILTHIYGIYARQQKRHRCV